MREVLSHTDSTIHELFDAQAERTPEATALIAGTERITYRELRDRSDRLARHLIQMGVGPEVLVGVCLERTPELIPALLGVLKAGGAYVPLDPAYPAKRLGFMLEDAAVRVVVTQERLLERLPESLPESGAGVLLLDGGLPETDLALPRSPRTSSPDNLAYLIYTSGSTGRPKGVAIQHRNAVDLIAWAAEELGPERLRGVLAATSIAFDLSIFEMFVPLSLGGTVILAENALKLPELPAAGEVTLVNTVPSAMGELLRVGGIPPGVITVNLAGEALSGALVRQVYERTAADRVYNLYGPSEDTTYSTFAWIRPGEEAPPSIGRPIAGTRAWLLDAEGAPVPSGEVGEIYLAGHGVTRGYLGRPELTAERYLPNPFSGSPGGRMYRTGDLARFRADGSLEFLGRVDHQVKIRGFRIELGEIEAELERHEAVERALVVAREQRLVAYVTLKAPAAPAGILKVWLRRSLPEHMVPAAFVALDAFPLLPNGKIDRASLPEPGPGRPELAEAYVAPCTEVEAALAAVWGEVLGIEGVGVHDGFFELGGHSLLAGRVASRLRAVLGIELQARDLFAAPTVAALAKRLESFEAAPPVRPVPREGDLPLSFPQQRLWFVDRLSGPRAVYNIPYVISLMGRLDAGALARALERVVERHEALRTCFAERDGVPVQVIVPITPRIEIEMPFLDLATVPRGEQEAEVWRLARLEAETPFDLSCLPLLRARLLRVGEEEHALLLNVHHIVADGWSMEVLVRELAAGYEAFARGAEPAFAGLPVQPADLAVWQRQWLTGERLEPQLAYWRERLAGLPPVLPLPTDRARPAMPSFAGGAEGLALSQPLYEDLKALGRREGATLYMVLLAAFGVLLRRYTGQDDAVVGSPSAGRSSESEGLIGLLVNMLVLRVGLGGDPGFREAVARSRQAALGAFTHQDVPFERLVEELAPARGLGHNPLFQVSFSVDRLELDADVPGLALRSEAVENGTAKFDLSLYLLEERGGLRARLEYAADLFDGATARRLLDNFEALLAGIAAAPERRLSELPVLAPAERRQVLEAWSTGEDRAGEEPAAPASLWDLLESQARRTPEALAVASGETRWNYRDLHREAGRLAARLRRLGVGPERVAAVWLDRSPGMVAALLAVLRAGGAYLPIDPGTPAERVALLLEDSGAVALVTREAMAASLPSVEIPTVFLDDLAVEEAVPEGVQPENLAYVIYTSGSTGRPKGVAVRHAGLVNLVRWHQRSYGLGPADRCTQLAGPAFDASVWEIWPVLAAGASLHIPDEETRLSPARLASWLAAEGITVSFLPTPLAEAVLEQPWPADASLRFLLTGGDRLHGAPPAGLPFELVNHYGPTEATVVTACRAVPSGEAGAPPIGRPIAGFRVYVLDRDFQPVPTGALGELHVGGAGLARGYLGQPALTAASFVPDPFSGETGARLYRTGDLVRFRPDGELEFVGRADFQVKIRGFRVELGEIESVLTRMPGVREAVAAVIDSRLVAWVVTAAGAAVSTGEIRSFLQTRLPDYMVPAAFAFLEAFPLTPNGKVDRGALPVPATGSGDEGEAPRTPLEEVVAAIWAQILGHGKVGVRDSFFELGGHSLTATQVMSRVRDAFGVDLPVRALFEEPTVAGLAARLGAALQEERGFLAPPMVPVPRNGQQPLSFAQQRLWFLCQLMPESPFYNMPAAMHLNGPLDRAALERSVNEIVRRHEGLRTSFGTAPGGAAVQVIAPALSIPMPLVDLRGLPQAERDVEAGRLGLEEARAPFDLLRGPLLRTLLLRTGGEAHVLVLNMHHIVSDGWSIGVFIDELAALYQAFAAGRPSPLPELSIQYADFAGWQRDWLQGAVLEAQLGYWLRQLEGAPPVHEMPTDRPRPAFHSYRGAMFPVRLSRALSDRLEALGRERGASLFMTLLAAWKVLLGRSMDRDDLVIGSPIANRNRSEIEGMIGFFVNMLVMRTRLKDGDGFRAFLDQVREVALGAYAHQDLPFERLVEELEPERDLGYNPLFQLAFALQNAPMKARGRLASGDSGVSLERHEIDWGTTRFDLTLHLWNKPEGLAGMFVYSTDLFDASTMARLAVRLETLLQGIAEAPDRPLVELPLLTESERATVLGDWPGEITAYPREASIPELFAAQAARHPERIALVDRTETLTYGELDRRANQVARRLLALGVGPDELVGLFMERSVEMVVAILGILKAGAAYLPLDVAYPKERLAFMLADGRPPVLIAHERLLDRLPEYEGAVLCMDRDRAALEAESGADPGVRVDPLGLAYVMYTSGSTGRPKGVAAVHRGVVRLVKETGYIRFSPEEVFLLLAPVSFDASTLELWGPLLNGGRLVVMPPDRPSLEDVGRAVREHGVTTLWLTASLFHLMVQERITDLAPLKQLLAGGDVLSVPHVERVLRELPGTTLINGYGPTESVTFTCCHPMQGEVSFDGPVPLGRPIANTRVYLLDRRLEPVPAGVPGELYIGGDGLARGYHGQPGLTAERFVPDPNGEPGARLYRTGDRARWLADGTVEFLGRVDNQVKIRGFRIEPGEIEAALQQQPGVRDAVVTVHTGEDGDKRLVAYVVQDTQEVTVEEEPDEQHVSHWQMLYESTYDETSRTAGDDPAFNIVGWNSSYTGAAIPASEMRVWQDSTVERILSLSPDRVLEIGCGTGLLLFRVAPFCSRYVGLDFSKMALDYVERQRSRPGLELPQVELAQRLADDFTGIEPGSFDTVIINSVVQYFPGVEYLVRVLEGAVAAVRPGGRIYVGDVRNLPLLRAFHTAVQIAQAPGGLAKAQLRHRVERELLQEEELVLSPSFFAALKRHLPAIGRVEVRMKRGRFHNELTQFRYDVVLHVGAPEADGTPELDWRRDGLSIDGLRRRLNEDRPAVLRVQRVPNARVAAAVSAAEILSGDGPEANSEEVWQAARASASGCEPEDFWALANELPYTVGVGWTELGSDGEGFDVLFERVPEGSLPEIEGRGPVLPATTQPRPWSAYANQPLQGRFARDLMPRLRSSLQKQLPEYMVPAAFVLMESFPISPNGKVNRRALPAPEAERVEEAGGYVAPRTPVEETLAALWAELLGLPRVGVNDDFFHQGGHSLMATRIVSRLRELFGVEVPLRTLFEARTIAELAEVVEEHQLQAVSGDRLDDLLAQIDGLSEDEIQRLLA